MTQKIVFYGPVRGKSNRVGGGEAGNERTVALLRTRLGYDVHVIAKAYGKGRGLKVIFLYLIETFFNILSALYLLAASWRRQSLHISGFYGSSVYVELIFAWIGRVVAAKVIYEVRAGGAKDYYDNGSLFYQWAFRKVLDISDVILSQGRSQIIFLQKISPNSLIEYYPNFVLDAEVGQDLSAAKAQGDVRIVYFGRLSPEKGLDVILGAVEGVSFPVALEMIGAISHEYKNTIEKLIEIKGLQNKIKISPPMSREELSHHLECFHFFIFPTKEPREGHSNALNEAMARGVVPVVSDWGFNRDVVNDEDLIVPHVAADEFSSRINKIWAQDGAWVEKSRYVRDRVTTLFSEESARKTLLTAYEQGR